MSLINDYLSVLCGLAACFNLIRAILSFVHSLMNAFDKGLNMSLPDTMPHSRAQKLLILGAVLLAALSMPLSFTGPALALPAIGHSLGGSAIALNWVTNAFMLSFGSCLMAAGALADQFGRRRLFILGVGGFAVTSLALAFAPNIFWLDVLRALQGVAGAAAFSGGAGAGVRRA